MAVQRHRAKRKKYVVHLTTSGDPVKMAKAASIKEAERQYNRKQGMKKRKTVTIGKKQ